MPTARINDHTMYYEVLGKGQPVLCMGGWGTFCHENHGQLARGLADRHQVVIFDYRGIRDSDDDPTRPSTMELHANDAIGLLDHLGLANVHLVGLVGIGACVCQEIAIRRPDLARSMLNMGAWCEVDDFLRDQLEMFRWIHRDLGFYPFQEAVTLLSFEAGFYNANRRPPARPGRWLEGTERPLRGALAADRRLRGLRFEGSAEGHSLPRPRHPCRQGRRDCPAQRRCRSSRAFPGPEACYGRTSPTSWPERNRRSASRTRCSSGSGRTEALRQAAADSGAFPQPAQIALDRLEIHDVGVATADVFEVRAVLSLVGITDSSPPPRAP